MPKDNHIVSVIIPTTSNEIGSIIKDALENQSRKPDEVIYSLDTQRKGVSWARNNGFKQSRGDLVAFLDDDCVPERDWLERLIGAIDKYKAAVAGGTYVETDPLLADRRNKKGFPQIEQIDTKGMVAAGGNIIFQRAWLDKRIAVDGFLYNEDLITGEDHELAWRLTNLGATLVFVPTNPKHLRKVGFLRYQKWQFIRGRGLAVWEQEIRRSEAKTARRKSLLWNPNGPRNSLIVVASALFYKVLGPFDFHNFRSVRNFFVYWLGEKSLGFGYVYEKLKRMPVKRKSSS